MTSRGKAISRALRETMPRTPFLDAAAILEAASARHLRAVPPDQALWLAAVAHVRHHHTDYDRLRDEGYERDAALFFVLEAVNDVLDRWGSRRRLLSREDGTGELGSDEPGSDEREPGPQD